MQCGLIKPFEETTAGEFEQAWRVACLGAMISVHTVYEYGARQQGTSFYGPTAALRGQKFAAFASEQVALRASRNRLHASAARRASMSPIVVLDGLIARAAEPISDLDRHPPAGGAQRLHDAISGTSRSSGPRGRTNDLRPFSEPF